jgi:hypothetical protein
MPVGVSSREGEAVEVRLRTDLMQRGRRPHRPQGWPRGRRRWRAKEGGEVAATIKLELARPHPNGCNPSHSTRSSDTTLAGDAQLLGDL